MFILVCFRKIFNAAIASYRKSTANIRRVLHMSSDQNLGNTENSSNVQTDPDGTIPEHVVPHANATDVDTQTPVTGTHAGNDPTSPFTEESLTTYVERTLVSISATEEQTPDTFPVTPSEKEKERSEIVQAKSSESEKIEAVPRGQKDSTEVSDALQAQLDTASETSGQPRPVDYFPTDISEIDDLFDIAGADTQKQTQAAAVYSDIFGSYENNQGVFRDTSDVECTKSELPTVSQPRQLSAKGRTLIRQCFSETTPTALPMDHLVVAFTESQVQNMLGALADESVLSSIHATRALLSEAMRSGISNAGSTKSKIPRRRCASESSGDETAMSGYSTTGYTTGALRSEDEYLTGQVRRQTPKPGEGTSSGNVLVESSIPAVLSPGYCVDDYQPLAQLCQGQTSSPANPSPPRKRRKVVGKPGKVKKEAYFKGINWTKTFVTGPLDPVHNKHKFYCQICKPNVSLKSKGARKIIRHFQSESHLRKDQR